MYSILKYQLGFPILAFNRNCSHCQLNIEYVEWE